MTEQNTTGNIIKEPKHIDTFICGKGFTIVNTPKYCTVSNLNCNKCESILKGWAKPDQKPTITT